MKVPARGRLSRRTVLLFGAVIVAAGCGGGTQGDPPGGVGSPPPAAGSSTIGTGPGVVTDPAPPGEADMVFDGQTLSFPDARICEMSADGFNFVFFAEDEQSQLRGSGSRFQSGDWGGGISVYRADVREFVAPLTSVGMSVVIEGDSLIFTGPVGTTPDDPNVLPPGGGLPTLKPLGEGTVRATCP